MAGGGGREDGGETNGVKQGLDMRAMACETAGEVLHSTIKHACYGVRDGLRSCHEARIRHAAMACETAGGSSYAAPLGMRAMACETGWGSRLRSTTGSMAYMACETVGEEVIIRCVLWRARRLGKCHTARHMRATAWARRLGEAKHSTRS